MLFQVKSALNRPPVLKISFSRRFYRDSQLTCILISGRGTLGSGIFSHFLRDTEITEFALQTHLNATITGTQIYSKVIGTPISHLFSHTHFCTTNLFCHVERNGFVDSLLVGFAIDSTKTGCSNSQLFLPRVSHESANPLQIQMGLIFRLINDTSIDVSSLQIIHLGASNYIRRKNIEDKI